MKTGTLYVRIRNASGEFRWWAFTVRDRNAVLKEYRVMRHVRTRRSIARMHVVCLLFATVGGDCLPVAPKVVYKSDAVGIVPAQVLQEAEALRAFVDKVIEEVNR